MATTHYVSTAENSGVLQTILPSDLRARGFLDDGMAQNGSINRALGEVGQQYCRPPHQAAWEALADVAAAAGISLTVEAEGLLRYAYDTWQSDNAGCRAVMQDVATGLGYMKARKPSVPLYVEHQAQLAANLPAPSGYADFVAHEVSLLGGLIAGCTIMGYYVAPSVGAINYTLYDQVLDFYRTTLGNAYPGKRFRIFTSSYLYDDVTDSLYVGDVAMQHVVDYANAHDCDLEWWSASVTAPLHAEAWTFLRGLGVVGAGSGSVASAGSAFESLFAGARALLLRQHGTAVTYDDGSGTTVPVSTAIVGAVADETIEVPGDYRQRYRHRMLTVSLGDVPSPKRPDKFTIDGEVWTVHERLPQDGGMARLLVVRPNRVDVGGRLGSR